MNLQIVIENLKNTIASKEKYLAELFSLATRLSWENESGGTVQDMATRAAAESLKLNINELERILHDIEQCIGVEE
jgi:hypothetical protein